MNKQMNNIKNISEETILNEYSLIKFTYLSITMLTII